MHVSALDSEWVQLIVEAKNMGLSIQEIQDFLSIHATEETGLEE